MENRDAAVTLDWADGTYTFRLGWGELSKLQEACDAGPYVILNRLYDRTWRIEDISNVIRLGLIGGGMLPVEALKLTRAYVETRPPLESLLTAQVVLSAACIGAPEEQIEKKSPAPVSELTTSPTASSGSGPSTVSGESSASRRKKSTECRSGNSSLSQRASARRAADSPQQRLTTSGNG